MTDQPREKLCELIATYGQTLCDDPRRCEALLRDLCAANRREIHALVSALRERVAADLLAASEGVPREVLRARLTQRLQDNLGLAEEIARWAVDSWALALGKLSRVELSAAAPRKAVSEGNVEAKQLSSPELNAVPPSSAPIASHTAPIGWRQRLGSPVIILIGLGVASLAVLMLLGVISLLDRSPRISSQQGSISTQPPTQLDQGTNPDQARPYPFGQDAIGYLKSIGPASGIYQANTHVYCTAFAKDAAQYCVAEHNGRVDGIQIDLVRNNQLLGGLTTPLGVAGFLSDLRVFRLSEERDGKEYLRGSSYTSVEVGIRLGKAWREWDSSYGEQFGRYIFAVLRKDQLALVFDADSDSFKDIMPPKN